MKKIIKLFKSSPKFTLKWDNYFEIYENILKKFVNKKITFVEIGVGNGGSLHMWKKFFGKRAKIIGIELNPEAKRLEKFGFDIVIGDQSNPIFWKKFYKKFGKIDVLLDDGGHKNIQQITTFMESYEHIKPNGMIVIEDTHTSFMKKKGFKNPSDYSFINFSKLIVESLHRRNPSLNKKPNKLSERIESIFYYDSIVSINFGKKKFFQAKLLKNNLKLEGYFVDYRHKGSFINTLSKFEKLLGKLNENTIIYKIIRKCFHRNFFITLNEKKRIRNYKKMINY